MKNAGKNKIVDKKKQYIKNKEKEENEEDGEEEDIEEISPILNYKSNKFSVKNNFQLKAKKKNNPLKKFPSKLNTREELHQLINHFESYKKKDNPSDYFVFSLITIYFKV